MFQIFLSLVFQLNLWSFWFIKIFCFCTDKSILLWFLALSAVFQKAFPVLSLEYRREKKKRSANGMRKKRITSQKARVSARDVTNRKEKEMWRCVWRQWQKGMWRWSFITATESSKSVTYTSFHASCSSL